MRTLRPASYTALDLNRAAVDFCRRTHHLPGVDFLTGDAEKLPFPDNAFDAVINIESSGAYPNFSASLPKLSACFALAGISCMPIFVPETRSRCGRPRWHRPRCRWFRARTSVQRCFGREFCGLKGTKFYRALQSGEYSYRMYALPAPIAQLAEHPHIASAKAICPSKPRDFAISR